MTEKIKNEGQGGIKALVQNHKRVFTDLCDEDHHHAVSIITERFGYPCNTTDGSGN
jgi:hypothetical protein